MDDSEQQQAEFECPKCGGMMMITTGDFEQIAACPLCHEDVTIPPTPESDEANFAAEGSEGDELDGRRIERRSKLRRAIYRSRSYAIIASIVCVVAAAQLGQFAYRAIQTGWIIWTIAYAIVMIAAIVGAVFFYRRAVALHQQARRSETTTPTTEPDFSTLGDGSQQWQNLHDVQ